MFGHLTTPPTLRPPLSTSLGLNEALPDFEVVLAKGWKELNRDLSFLREVTTGLAQCPLASLCVFRRVCHRPHSRHGLGSAVVR